MGEWRGLSVGVALECAERVSSRAWALVGLGQMEGGDCLIADISNPHDVQVKGLYYAATGDVFDCENDELAQLDDARLMLAASYDKIREKDFAVHILGSIGGETGQLTVRQPAGNYLRACRWDRIKQGALGRPNAILRTLPQCGCGGSLGAPQLFDSFVEMSTYHFCAFCAEDAVCRI